MQSFLLPPSATASKERAKTPKGGIQAKKMTAGEPPPPHQWDTDVNLSKEASRMFQDVANGIDKNQTGERAVILFCQSRRICTKMP